MLLSTPRRLVRRSILLPALLLASGCTTLAGTPPLADLAAVTEAKPVPTDAIATDPVAEAHYNAALEAWGDRLYSAGGRLCRFFDTQGVTGMDCPKQ